MHKRRTSRTESTEDTGLSSSQKQQRTIKDLFSASSTSKKGELSQPPLHKRRRLGDPVDEGSIASLSSTTTTVTTVDMYRFSSLSASTRPSTSSGAQDEQTSSRSNHFTPHTGARKLAVRNLKSIPRVDPDNYVHRSWTQLEDALAATLKNERPDLSLEQLYRTAENTCRLGNAQQLLECIRKKFDQHLNEVIMPSLQRGAQVQDSSAVLRAVNRAWLEWNERLVSIRSIFYYLDQSYLLHSIEHSVLQEQGVSQFRSIVFGNPALSAKVVEGICVLVDRDRKAEDHVDTDLFRSSIKMVHRLGVYASDVEPTFLARSTAYYSGLVETAATALASYVHLVRDLFDRELTRCDLYFFDRSTRQKLNELMDTILIAEKREFLLNQREIENLITSRKHTTLRQLYELLHHLSIDGQLKIPLKSCIVSKGTEIVFDKEHESEMVPRLLELKNDADTIVNESFDRNRTLQDAVRDAFDDFMNKPIQKGTARFENTKTGEMIAKYVDYLLRGGWKIVASHQGKNASQISMNQADEDAEMNRQLDKVLELFRWLHGKAVFEAFYKNDLAKRLLMGKSANDGAETSMLVKLRSECGQVFTQNLETMFSDMDLSRNEMKLYNLMLQERSTKRKLELNVHVLSEAAWPSYPDADVTLPTEIANALKDFEVFYLGKSHGRKLTWKHPLAYGLLKARFPKGNKELIVSAYQTFVLLLFNDLPDSKSVTYEEIRAASNIPDVDLKRTLQSLACAHYRVLIKEPKGREVNETDRFSYNANFQAEKFRIKINQVQSKKTKAENQSILARVASDRQYETQAATVRIMKARKKISHSDLIAEVINATKHRGTVLASEVKRSIDNLIEKEYMERDGDRDYVYIA